jgi:hypothetical protein
MPAIPNDITHQKKRYGEDGDLIVLDMEVGFDVWQGTRRKRRCKSTIGDG